jgi:hypothetical protein
MSDRPDQGFYSNIPPFSGFVRLMEAAHYRRLPDDWTIGLTDIVKSTDAISERRYKAVNTAGAATIAAIANALSQKEFPFVFGGDGASFALPDADLELAREAMAATAAWVRDSLGLDMRIALIPVADIRSQGHDVLVARYAPSPDVSYAMFTGGGLGWAEAAIKRGEFAVAPAPSGAVPDLTGLSCRFERMPASRGVILSVIAIRAKGAPETEFRAFIEHLVTMIERSGQAGSPVPGQGPQLRWPPEGLDLEAWAMRGGPLLFRRALATLRGVFVYGVMRYGVSLGGFVPARYIRELVANTDFRKYDDGLRMILDCPEALATDIERQLQEAAARNVVRFGLHRQEAAIMTCFTPSPTRSDHVHFVDGADGGYARAAVSLKEQLATDA